MVVPSVVSVRSAVVLHRCDRSVLRHRHLPLVVVVGVRPGGTRRRRIRGSRARSARYSRRSTRRASRTRSRRSSTRRASSAAGRCGTCCRGTRSSQFSLPGGHLPPTGIIIGATALAVKRLPRSLPYQALRVAHPPPARPASAGVRRGAPGPPGSAAARFTLDQRRGVLVALGRERSAGGTRRRHRGPAGSRGPASALMIHRHASSVMTDTHDA